MEEARKFSIFARSVVAETVTYAVGLAAAAVYYAPLAYEKAKAGTLSNAASNTQVTHADGRNAVDAIAEM